jgi:pimeloyl-ACP methyl ester carboxylesterase
LFYDYRTNVPLYPKFQAWLRDSAVPVIAIWGKHDEIFILPGGEAYARDVKKENFELHALDAGHFAIETNEVEIAGLIKAFLGKRGI